MRGFGHYRARHDGAYEYPVPPISGRPWWCFMEDLLLKSATVVAVALAGFSSFPSTAQQDNQASVQQAQPQAQTSAAVQLQPVTGELVNKLDSKSAKPGDSVIVKTSESVRIPDGTEIPKGSKLVGHITNVQPRAEGKENSQIAIQFDRAELKDGQILPIESVIQSISPSVGDTMNNNHGMMPMASSPGAPSAGSMPGGAAPGSSSSGANQNANNDHPGLASNTTAQPGDTSQNTNSSAPAPGSIVARNGNVAIRTTAVPGVLLANNINGQPFANASGMLVGARRDVKLDGGTQMVVALATAPQGAGSGMSR